MSVYGGDDLMAGRNAKPPREKKVGINVTLSRDVLRAVDAEVRETGLTRSGVIEMNLRKQLKLSSEAESRLLIS